MKKLSSNKLAVAIGGSALALVASAGVASATPDLGPVVNTTCNYRQLTSALDAQGNPQVSAAFNQSPQLKAGLQLFVASGPEKRQEIAEELVSSPQFGPYLGTIENAFLTCNNFQP
ncbi:hemophore-related protein [Mycobacterium sp. 1274761.0]|uniref:hemophore-related protein n=1 Tax=Mycobacterium sp. 1274761.0 TaxID=1834077 RepID=UPI0007FBB3A6|nr:hemophore-related protein [Mycobacterium sp. 1274761.0]OBK74292.1 hypothetical protein A5651_10875 [Mycobacterium sp. 1274761.0]